MNYERNKNLCGGQLEHCYIYQHLVKYHWKYLLIKLLMSLKKGFEDISGQNGCLPKYTYYIILIGLTYTLGSYTIILPSGFNRGATQNGLTITNTKLSSKLRS